MANVIIPKEVVDDIADAIREKLGTTDKYKMKDMAAAIREISGGGDYKDGNKEAF